MTDCAALPLPELLAALEARGVGLWVEDGALKLRAKGKVTEDEKQRLRDSKPEVIALLQGDERGPIGLLIEEAHGSLPGGNGPKADAEPEPAPSLEWETAPRPQRSKLGLPPWLRGDSKPVLVRTTSTGVRIYNDFDD